MQVQLLPPVAGNVTRRADVSVQVSVDPQELPGYKL